jgi:stringent starvation protein B
MTTSPTKKDLMLALLERAEASLHLDARRLGVILPAHLLSEPHVRLDYGYSLVPPIADLEVGDEGVSATLSFNRAPFRTFVPWGAVYAIADFEGHGAVWQEDIPTDILDGVEREEVTLPPDTPSPSPRRPPHLKLVK